MTPMQWFRDHYSVPAKRGGRIRFDGRQGRITSGHAGHLVIHLDGEPASRRHHVHPCWRMEYLDVESLAHITTGENAHNRSEIRCEGRET